MHTQMFCLPNQKHIQMLNEQRKNSKTGKGGLEDEPLLDWENYYSLVSYKLEVKLS